MLEQIYKAITVQQDKQTKTIFILSLIEPILQRFHGKKITKRIQTAVESQLSEYTLFYGKVYSWYQLDIWGNGIDYSDRISLNLGYNDIFDFQSYVKGNQRYYFDKSRYAELDMWVHEDFDELRKLVDKRSELITLMDEFKKDTQNLPYPISQFLKI